MGMGVPGDRSRHFGPTFRRLLGELRPERVRILLVMLLAIGSVVFTVVGPKLLGDATDLVFEGVVSSQMPPGSTQAQVEAQPPATPTHVGHRFIQPLPEIVARWGADRLFAAGNGGRAARYVVVTADPLEIPL